MAALWAATTFLFLEMPLNATAATISVAGAAFGGPHAEGWPALPLHLQVTNPFAQLLEARKERDGPVLVHAQGRVVGSAARAFWSCCVRCVRVRPCDHEARKNVRSDPQGACWEY